MCYPSEMTRTAVIALRLAARKQGVTAAQLAKEAGVKVRAAQKRLFELLGNHGELGVMTREHQSYSSPPGQSPGRPSWVYYLRK